MNNIEAVLAQQTQKDDALREIFERHFDLEGQKDNIGYQAYARMAVEVCISIANVILSMKHPESRRGLRAIQDLTYGLNSNDFWMKNASVLLPVLTVIINAQKDFATFQLERKTMQEYGSYDKLISGSETVCLEIFSVILYLVGGPSLMSLASAPLKIDLAPHFLG